MHPRCRRSYSKNAPAEQQLLLAAGSVSRKRTCALHTHFPDAPVRHRDEAWTCLSHSPARSQAAQGHPLSQGGCKHPLRTAPSSPPSAQPLIAPLITPIRTSSHHSSHPETWLPEWMRSAAPSSRSIPSASQEAEGTGANKPQIALMQSLLAALV